MIHFPLEIQQTRRKPLLCTRWFQTICYIVLGAAMSVFFYFIFSVGTRNWRPRKFLAPADSKLLGVIKGQEVSRQAWGWNHRAEAQGCKSAKGDNVICSEDAYRQRPTEIPDGYCIVYYTTGCPACPVGWVYARGKYCENCLNCMN